MDVYPDSLPYRELIIEENPFALFMEDMDEAIIGICRKAGSPSVLAYDYDKYAEVLMEQENMSYGEAVEWMEFNVVSAYMGEHTPVFIES